MALGPSVLLFLVGERKQTQRLVIVVCSGIYEAWYNFLSTTAGDIRSYHPAHEDHRTPQLCP